MSLSNIFDIAGSAMTAQTIRLNTVASNLANADSMAPSADKVYKGLKPVFASVYNDITTLEQRSSAQVKVVDVVEVGRAPERRYEPGNPNASEDGFVFYSNVNSVEEMADMMSASRSYETAVEIINSVKAMQQGLLSIGK